MAHVLVVGVGRFDSDGGDESPDPLAIPKDFDPLPSVAPAVSDLAAQVGKTPGLRVLGDGASHDPDLATLTRLWRGACREMSGSGSPEALIVHFAGHGIPGPGNQTLFLATRETDRDNAWSTAPQVSTWLGEAESSPAGLSVLLLLDVCGAGRAVVQQLLDGVRAEDRRAWVIAACAPDEKTYRARFTTATAAVLERLRQGRLDLSPAVEHVPVETLAREIDRELARTAAAEGCPAQSVLRTTHPEARVPIPPFLLNPSYRETPGGQFRQAVETGLWQFAAAVDPGLDPLHFISRASGAPQQQGLGQGCFFTGRVKQLKVIKQWLEDAGGPSLLVVTGSPGSGKSALLGVVACLAHPQLREVTAQITAVVDREARPEPMTDLAAVHARQRGPSEVLSSLATQLGLGDEPSRGWTTRAVLDRIAEQRDTPVTVVVDALDEASLDRTLLNDVLIPLARTRRRADDKETGKNPVLCRVLIGTRPWWDQYGQLFDELDGNRQLVDLDKISVEQRTRELTDYLCDVLAASKVYSGVGVADLRKATAAAVAKRLGAHHDRGAFLLASLFAHYLVHQDTALPVEEVMARIPAHLPGMLDLHLEVLRREHPAMPAILAAIAHGYGQGMPLEVIDHVTSAFLPTGMTKPDVDDIRKALQAASFYLRFDTDSDGQRLYRFYHQSLVDHLRRQYAHISRRDICGRVLDTVPGLGEPSSRRFGLALPYVLRHAAQHARDARMLDQLLLSASFLIHCDPQLLGEHLAAGTARTEIAAIISDSALSPLHEPWQRRQWLRNTAVVWGETWLVNALDSLDEHAVQPAKPSVLDFHWGTADRHDRADGPIDVDEVSLVRHADRWLVVVSGFEGGVGLWDVRTGVCLFPFDSAESSALHSLRTWQGREGPLAVAGTDEGRIKVWDLDTGALRVEIRTDAGAVVAVSVVRWADDDLVVACGAGEVVAYDLSGRRVASLDVLGDWLTSLEAEGAVGDLWEPDEDIEGYDCTAVATTTLDGVPVFVAGAVDGSLHVWEAGGRSHRNWRGGIGRIHSLQILEGRGGPFVFTSGDDGVRLWDLRTGGHRLLKTVDHHRGFPLLDDAGNPRLTHFRRDFGIVLQDIRDGSFLADPFCALPEEISYVQALEISGSQCAAVGVAPYGVEFLFQAGSGADRTLHAWTGHDTEVELVAVGETGDTGITPAVSVDAYGYFVAWDASTGSALWAGIRTQITAVAAGTLAGKSVVVLAHGRGKSALTEIIDLGNPSVIADTVNWGGTVNALSIDVVNGSPQLTVQAPTEISTFQPGSPPSRLDTDEKEETVIRCYARHSHGGQDITVVGTSSSWMTAIDPECPAWLTLHGPSGASHALAECDVYINCTDIGVWGTATAAVYGGEEGFIAAVCLETRQELHRFPAHEGAVRTLTFVQPHGIPLLVSSGTDDTLRIWDPRRPGTLLAETGFPDTLTGVSAGDAGVFTGFGSRVAFFAWADLAQPPDPVDGKRSS
ncbi:hypothetical protein E2C11_20875 [Streptomyces lavendulae]|nr:hypothetical protein [Streptomyces lavendulae]TXJ76248.1 hypothetical protein E2C11_20875 [Streptomyces lavendulae]